MVRHCLCMSIEQLQQLSVSASGFMHNVSDCNFIARVLYKQCY